jgi:AcrR family transcriptional regulator
MFTSGAGAGLAPHSGALYRYFDSKLAVLEAGLQRHLASIADVDVDLDLSGAPATEMRAEIEALVRWLLAELDRERTITHVLEREGDRLPELRDRMRTDLSDRGYRIAATFIGRWTAHTRLQPTDHEALAVLLIGGLVNLRRSTWTFGAPPLGLGDDRTISAFLALSTTPLDAPH